MVCRKCGKEISDSSLFCDFCGCRVADEKVKQCPACKKKYPASKSYCEDCGIILQKITFVSPSSESEVEKVNPSVIIKMKKTLNTSVSESGSVSTGKSVLKINGFVTKTDKSEVRSLTREKKTDEKPLKVLKSVSRYSGKPQIGIPDAEGDLELYTNCVRFRTASHADTVDFSDVENVEKSVFGSVMPCMVMTMKNNSFCSYVSVNDYEITEAIKMLSGKL